MNLVAKQYSPIKLVNKAQRDAEQPNNPDSITSTNQGINLPKVFKNREKCERAVLPNLKKVRRIFNYLDRIKKE